MTLELVSFRVTMLDNRSNVQVHEKPKYRSITCHVELNVSASLSFSISSFQDHESEKETLNKTGDPVKDVSFVRHEPRPNSPEPRKSRFCVIGVKFTLRLHVFRWFEKNIYTRTSKSHWTPEKCKKHERFFTKHSVESPKEFSQSSYFVLLKKKLINEIMELSICVTVSRRYDLYIDHLFR